MKNKFLFLAVMSIAATSNSQSIPKDPFAGLINRSGNLEFESGVKIIENKGQIKDENNQSSSEVLFAIQGNGGNAYLKSNALCIQFNHWFIGDKIGKRIDQFWSAYRFDLKLKNSNPNPQIITEGKSKFVRHFYEGAKSVINDVHDYQKVILKDIYPNIDWCIIVLDGRLKYEFWVHPGGDPGNIQIEIENGESSILSNGDLIVKTPYGDYSEKAPISFQNNETIDTRFLLKDNLLQFQLGEYNKNQVLQIDPELLWGSYFADGDVTMKEIVNHTIDGSGNIYMTYGNGSKLNNFKTNINSLDTAQTFSNSAILKLDTNRKPEWAFYLGSKTIITGIVSDSGSIYISGYTEETGLSKGSNIHQSVIGGKQDMFIARLLPDGEVNWLTYFGGTENDGVYPGSVDFETLAINKNGRLSLIAQTQNYSGLATTGAFMQSHTPSINYLRVYVHANFNTSDGSLIWSTYSGIEEEAGNAFTPLIDDNDNVYHLAFIEKAKQSTIKFTMDNISKGDVSGIVLKFDKNGKKVFGKYIDPGADKFLYINGGTITKHGDLVIVGSTNNDTFLVEAPKSGYFNPKGTYNGYTMKLNSKMEIEWYCYNSQPGFDMNRRVVELPSGHYLTTNIAFKHSEKKGFRKNCSTTDEFDVDWSKTPDYPKIVCTTVGEIHPNGIFLSNYSSESPGIIDAEKIKYSEYYNTVFVSGTSNYDGQVSPNIGGATNFIKNGYQTTFNFPANNSTLGLNGVISEFKAETDTLLNIFPKSFWPLVIWPDSTGKLSIDNYDIYPTKDKKNVVYSWLPSGMFKNQSQTGAETTTIDHDTMVYLRVESGCQWDTVNIYLKHPNYDDTLYYNLCPGDSKVINDSFSVSNIQNDTMITLRFQSILFPWLDSLQTSIVRVRPIKLSTPTIVDNQCKGGKQGSIDFDVLGGHGKLKFLWSRNGSSYDVTEDIASAPEGIYILKVTDGQECSITSDTLVIQEPSEYPNDTITIQTCSSYEKNGKTYTSNVLLSDTLRGQALLGCDSIVYINVEFLQTYSDDTPTINGCWRYATYKGKTYDYYEGDKYLVTDTTTNSKGCDSILYFFLKIGPPPEWEDGADPTFITACNYWVAGNGDTLRNSMYYYDTLKNFHGCDSIYRQTVLTIVPIDLSVRLQGPYLISNQDSAKYQWLDCNNDYSEIPSAIYQNYNPPGIGYFAVEISRYGCIDTTECIPFGGANIDDISSKDIIVHPNPSKGLFSVEANTGKIVKISIFNMNGVLIHEIDDINATSTDIDLSSYTQGLYQLKIDKEDHSAIIRILKID